MNMGVNMAAQWPRKVLIFTDGASRGNPGPASIGISFVDESSGEEVFYWGEPLGHQTNNFAEYFGVLKALEIAEKNGVDSFELRSDSQLLIRQILGQYKVKNENLKPLFQEVKGLERKFKNCRWVHVAREENTRADELANMALDCGGIVEP